MLSHLILIPLNYQKTIINGVSWVKPNNLHITLKFIGDVKIEQIVDLDIVLNKFIKNLTKENSNLIKNTQINLVEKFESFILFESILTPQGSIYQPLKEYVI